MDVTPINNKPTTKKSITKKMSLSSKQKKLMLVIITILLLAVAFVCVYKYSYNKGYKEGEKAGKKSATTTNPRDIFNSMQNPFKTLTGQVEKVDGETITLTTSNGETKTIKITEKTKITKKKETLNKDALKKGTKITVFTQNENDNLSATRIVVQ